MALQRPDAPPGGTPATAPGPAVHVTVQAAAFDAGAEIDRLRRADAGTGGLAVFIGQVRDVNDGDAVTRLTLEHYPGMTEASIEAICADAGARWALTGIRVVHRVGPLAPLDPIVLVVVASAHRGNAFQACEYVMDRLKTEAPFWKKEQTTDGERWVQARASDDSAVARWQEAPGGG